MGVSYGQSMRVVSRVVRQKFRRLVDGHVINLTLHWAKEVVVKVRYMDSLVNHNVIYLAGQRVIIGKCTTNGSIGLSAKGGVIPFNINSSFMIKQN